jgi:hypothetical protein
MDKKAQLNTTNEHAAITQKRSNHAIINRDDSNYALKHTLIESEKHKDLLKVT